MVCAFTGHRPQRLPWGSNELDPRCEALKKLLSAAVAQAVKQGYTTFLCGMARGCDTYFAEAVLAQKQNDPCIELIAMLPCPEQSVRWPAADRQRYEQILSCCSAVEILSPSYDKECMLRRNRAMVERAQMLISVYDGGSGGTGQTVRLAREKGMEIRPVWL